MARVHGRTIVPTTEDELAVLNELGLNSLRVSRKHNPYSVARRLKRAAQPHPDLEYLRSIVRPPGLPGPDQAFPPAAPELLEVAAE